MIKNALFVSTFPVTRSRVALLLLFTLAAGTANTALMVIINMAMSMKGQWQNLSLLFSASFLVYIVCERISQRGLNSMAERFLLNIRRQLVEKLLRGKYEVISGINEERILGCITTDAVTISRAGSIIFLLVISTIKLISGLLYLAYLSQHAFLITLLTVSAGIVLYLFVSKTAIERLNKRRETEDAFLKHVQDMILGSKELKLNRIRRTDFNTKDIKTTCATAEENSRTALEKFTDAGLIGDGVFYLLIGAVAIFFEPLFGINADINRSFVIALMFLVGPLSTIMLNYPSVNMVYISARRLNDLYEQLSQNQEISCRFNVEKTGLRMYEGWREIKLTNVAYDYKNQAENTSFHLGPLDMDISRGELIFIIGGNGSGKTTLGKIITGLYPAQTGSLTVDEVGIDETNRDDYRQLFSAVFSDYHLFPHLYGVDFHKVEKSSKEILNRLGLAKKINIFQGRFSSINLSRGERKRLALANSYFENRSLLFFDEWAADQDPIYKDYFYTTLLPALKAEGNTIIAITHDDRYFYAADRVLKLESGKIIAWRSSESVLQECGAAEEGRKYQSTKNGKSREDLSV